jgi:hypothetical protein
MPQSQLIESFLQCYFVLQASELKNNDDAEAAVVVKVETPEDMAPKKPCVGVADRNVPVKQDPSSDGIDCNVQADGPERVNDTLVCNYGFMTDV